MDKIYKISNKEIDVLDSGSFDSEKELQNLTIEHPELLGLLTEGDNLPFLISDEVRISTGRIDNFLVDIDATPILIEVKERSNLELKRKVAGQLLDYASTISNDLIDMDFEQEIILSCKKYGFNIEDILETLYSIYEKEEFWSIFKKNLKNNRFKLVVLADKFFASTERIIQYLNQETVNTNFIGLELMKFNIEGDMVIVPKLIGSPYFSTNTKYSSKSLNDEDIFLEQLKNNKMSSVLDFIDRIDQWAVDNQLHFKYNDGQTATRQYRLDDERNTLLCSTTSKGEISFRLGELKKILTDEVFQDFFDFLDKTFGKEIFAKPNKKEVGPQFASILMKNITNEELEILLKKFESTFGI